MKIQYIKKRYNLFHEIWNDMDSFFNIRTISFCCNSCRTLFHGPMNYSTIRKNIRMQSEQQMKSLKTQSEQQIYSRIMDARREYFRTIFVLLPKIDVGYVTNLLVHLIPAIIISTLCLSKSPRCSSRVDIHNPTLWVNLPYTSAIKAAPCSCLVNTNLILDELDIEITKSLVSSPGKPKNIFYSFCF